MAGWPRPRKRLLLAAMLLPLALVTAAWPLVGLLFVHHGGPGWALDATAASFVGGFLIAFVAALMCVADAVVDRRVRSTPARTAWAIALVLAPAVAPATYWWLHVRPQPDEPHGLEILRPASTWTPRAKAATGAAAIGPLVLIAGWRVWFAIVFTGDPEAVFAVPAFGAFGLLVATSCAVLTLFFLDAVREGGTHAIVWAILLVLVWPLAAPLYWLLYVRPTAPPGGGP